MAIPSGSMQYRVLGRTGVQVSALGLGGSHIGTPKLSSAEAVKIIQAALDGGLSFMDNSWDYHEGESENRLGKALKGGYRSRAKVVKPIECLHYALNLPTSVVITGIDSMKILKQAFHAAASFKPLSRQQVAKLRAKSGTAASNGEFELFKTTTAFDSTIQHPEWLGEESSRTQRLAGD